jgi:hypothetical protein
MAFLRRWHQDGSAAKYDGTNATSAAMPSSSSRSSCQILLLVVFGITEFGRAFLTLNILNTAAREGARLAVVTAPDVDASAPA